MIQVINKKENYFCKKGVIGEYTFLSIVHFLIIINLLFIMVHVTECITKHVFSCRNIV